MSIERIGTAETKGYADGFEAIFGKRTRFQVSDEPAIDDNPQGERGADAPREAADPTGAPTGAGG